MWSPTHKLEMLQEEITRGLAEHTAGFHKIAGHPVERLLLYGMAAVGIGLVVYMIVHAPKATGFPPPPKPLPSGSSTVSAMLGRPVGRPPTMDPTAPISCAHLKSEWLCNSLHLAPGTECEMPEGWVDSSTCEVDCGVVLHSYQATGVNSFLRTSDNMGLYRPPDPDIDRSNHNDADNAAACRLSNAFLRAAVTPGDGIDTSKTEAQERGEAVAEFSIGVCIAHAYSC